MMGVATLLGSDEEPRDLRAAPEHPIPSTDAQDDKASVRVIRAVQGQSAIKHGQNTEWMESAPPSQDDAISTVSLSISPKRTKKLRRDRDGGPRTYADQNTKHHDAKSINPRILQAVPTFHASHL